MGFFWNKKAEFSHFPHKNRVKSGRRHDIGDLAVQISPELVDGMERDGTVFSEAYHGLCGDQADLNKAGPPDVPSL